MKSNAIFYDLQRGLLAGQYWMADTGYWINHGVAAVYFRTFNGQATRLMTGNS